VPPPPATCGNRQLILLWGLPGDRSLTAVRRALKRVGCAVALVDQRAIADTEVELFVDGDIRGGIRVKRQFYDLAAVSAAYLRPYSATQLPSVRCAGSGSRAWQHAAAVDELLWCWADLTPALVVNRPAVMASNNSKPYQSMIIRTIGFNTPDTLVTTDARAAREFWARYETVVYKSISGVRSIVARLGPHHEPRLENIRWCPTQFQEYISGTDWRVHVVADEIFSCEIRSGATDYRYAAREGLDVELCASTLPPDCAARCYRLAQALGLTVAGIDLRLSRDGKWYCFEVNPSPGFTYYQAATGQPIEDAIAGLLASGSLSPDLNHPGVSGGSNP